MLEHYPRDELFQVDEETLYQFSLAILQLDERPRVRGLARRAVHMRRNRLRVVLGDAVTVAGPPYDPPRGPSVFRAK